MESKIVPSLKDLRSKIPHIEIFTIIFTCEVPDDQDLDILKQSMDKLVVVTDLKEGLESLESAPSVDYIYLFEGNCSDVYKKTIKIMSPDRPIRHLSFSDKCRLQAV